MRLAAKACCMLLQNSMRLTGRHRRDAEQKSVPREAVCGTFCGIFVASRRVWRSGHMRHVRHVLLQKCGTCMELHKSGNGTRHMAYGIRNTEYGKRDTGYGRTYTIADSKEQRVKSATAEAAAERETKDMYNIRLHGNIPQPTSLSLHTVRHCSLQQQPCLVL